MVAKTLTIPHLRSIGQLRQSSLVRAGLWSMADQALISATNFVTMVLLARNLSPSAFGAFTLAYTALLFANSLQAALITQPHNVIGATRTGEDYVSYTTATAGMQLVLALACGLICAVGALVLDALDISASRLLLALAPAIVVWQLQEFIRRVLYTKHNVIGALVNDGISYGGQLVGIVVLWRMDSLTEVRAILVLAITSAGATVVGLWQIRHHLTADLIRVAWHPMLSENWRLGKWLTSSALVSWSSSQLYPILTAGLVGAAATGAIRATQTVLGPTQVLVRAIDISLSSPIARNFRDKGNGAVRSLVRKTFLATAPIMGGYCALTVVFAHPLLRFLYDDNFSSYSWLLWVAAAGSLLTYSSTPLAVALRATGHARPLFSAQGIATCLALTLGIGLVHQFHLIGTAIAWILHGIVINAWLAKSYFANLGPLHTELTDNVGIKGSGHK